MEGMRSKQKEEGRIRKNKDFLNLPGVTHTSGVTFDESTYGDQSKCVVSLTIMGVNSPVSSVSD